jgi:peroxiredoxin
VILNPSVERATFEVGPLAGISISLMNLPTTSQELAQAREHYRTERIPRPALKVMDAATAALVADGAAGRALQPGAPAPDFILPDSQGAPVRLNQLLATGPVVLVFYRGGWCPYCNIHLRGYQRMLGEFRAAGAHVVAVSPQLPNPSLETRMGNDLEFPVLSDVGLHVARAFGIVFTLPPRLLDLYAAFGHPLEGVNGDAGATELPIPATFVIGRDSRILHTHADEDYTSRSEPEEVLKVVTAIRAQPRVANQQLSIP